MTQPPNPYGLPPGPSGGASGPASSGPPGAGGGPPGAHGRPPPNPSGRGPQPPRRGLSNVAKFWIGVGLCLPLLFVVGALQALPGAVANALSLPPELGQFSALGLDVALLAAMVVGLVVEKTRFYVVGVLAGLAVLFVLAAGACVLLLSGLGSSY